MVIKAAKTEDGKPVNPLQVLNYLSEVYVVQGAWIDTLFERNGDDAYVKVLVVPVMKDGIQQAAPLFILYVVAVQFYASLKFVF